MNNTIWNLIEPVVGERTGDVVRWLDQRGGRVEDGKGGMVYLDRLSLSEWDEEKRHELARYVCGLYRAAGDRPVPNDVEAVAQEDRAVADPPNTAPRPRPEPAPDAPRREYDDETLAGLVLEFLREHRAAEFTYNQVKDELNVEWKQASRVLENLVKRSDDVVRFDEKSKKGEPLKLYKFAPHRKALDRNYSRAEEIVSSAIVEYLSEEPHKSGTEVRKAMQAWFGRVNDHLVRSSLQALVDSQKVTTVPGPRRSTLHSV